MADNTLIGWCDSTVNPVMGCEGCPLWPTPSALRKSLAAELIDQGVPMDEARRLASEALDGLTATDAYQRRKTIARDLARRVKRHDRREAAHGKAA